MTRGVIVGAFGRGVHAAKALRMPGFGGAIVLTGEEPHPHDRTPLSNEQLTANALETPSALLPVD